MSNKFSNYESTDRVNGSVEDLINTYSNKSTQELMQEFLTLSATKKKQGTLNAEYVSTLRKTIFPYLTEEQKAKFDQLLGDVL